MTADNLSPGPSDPVPDDQAFGALAMLLRQWRILLGLTVLTPALTGGLSLLLPPAYVATATFVSQSRGATRMSGALGALGGLSSQLGLPFSTEPSESPRFYARVLTSRDLLNGLLLSSFPDPRPSARAGDSIPLIALLQVRGRSPADSLERGVRKLRRKIGIDVDNQTGVVQLSVESRYPALAAEMTNQLLDSLNGFNARMRELRARDRRAFTASRAAEEDSGMRAAEEDLAQFYQRNRQWQQSPQLVVEEGRLRRRIDLRQEVYVALQREYDMARIEEMDNTPTIGIIDRAAEPQRRAKPRYLLLLLLGVVFGSILGVVGALWADRLMQLRSKKTAAYLDLQDAAARVGREIASLLRTNPQR